MKLFAIALLTSLLFQSPASAATETLMIGISRTAQDAAQAIADLNAVVVDPTPGPVDCSYSLKVTDVFPESLFESPTYSSVALVELEAVSDCGINQAADKLSADGRYELFSNPRIGPNPALSGGTK